MDIFISESGKLKRLQPHSVKEKFLQQLVEQNLEEVLEMYFLATEYETTADGRIDTLAIDYNGSPVIIEYKRSRDENIINQALWYLNWLKAQKVDFFEMLVMKKLEGKLPEGFTIDWKSPRVVCIAESYSKYDIGAVKEMAARLELFRYQYYDNGLLSLERVNVAGKIAITKVDTKIAVQNEVSDLKPIIVNETSDSKRKSKFQGAPSVDDYLKKVGVPIQKMFLELRNRILQLDENIVEKATSAYIGYRLSKNFLEIHLQKNRVVVHLRPIAYDDPRKMVEKVPDTNLWTLDRKVFLTSVDEMDYVMRLIEESYRDVL